MKKYLSLVLIAVFGLGTISSFGRFARPELEDVPLQRILENLSKKAEEAPDDAATNHHLARTHAMAFAKKIGDEDVVKAWQGWGKKDPLSPWFGYQPKFVPFGEVKEIDDAEKSELAKAHLESAIAYYRKALEAKPDEHKIKLGLAWCLTQNGDNEAAIPLLRVVATAAWEKESKSRGTFGPILYVETADYLAPLLDKEKDADELADMEKKKQKLLALPRAVTPIVVPLADDMDPNSLIDREARVRFDLDGSGRTPEWQWITKDAAWFC